MRVEIVYFNAGGGHRSAANALQKVMTQKHGWEVVLTNLFDILDPKRLFQRIVRHDHEDLYNKALASGFTIGLGPQLKVLQATIRAQRKSFATKLREHWAVTKPDFVVSVIPNFNLPIGDSIDGPFATVITDLSDLPPHFWIEPELKNQHVIAGTEFARAQAIVAGILPKRVHLVSGMVLRPEFYESPELTTRERVRPTGLVMFGGIGSKEMVPIAEALHKRWLILVCGKNEKLHKQLVGLKNPKHAIVGFVSDMPSIMRQCDYFIGKPGPGSISEAVHMGLPVIVPLNAFTMPQERWNVEFVKAEGLGIVVKSFKDIDQDVSNLITRLPELQANTRRSQNRAVFEIPDVLLARCMIS